MGWWYVCRRAKCLFEHQDKCFKSGQWFTFETYMSCVRWDWLAWWPIARCDLCKKLSWKPFEVYPFGVKFEDQGKD